MKIFHVFFLNFVENQRESAEIWSALTTNPFPYFSKKLTLGLQYDTNENMIKSSRRLKLSITAGILNTHLYFRINIKHTLPEIYTWKRNG